jgi:5-methylcytosine-specific restriction endonuclease McrA
MSAQRRRFRLVLQRPEGAWCAYCWRPATTVDHVEPRSRGGSSVALDNLVPCCGSCNFDKDDLPLVVFLALTA